jgi:aspartate aminotransferase
LSCRKPQGAFYVVPNIEALRMTSSELAGFLLEKAGVAVLAGSDFGSYGEGYLRITYSNSVENITRAINLIADAVKNLD